MDEIAKKDVNAVSLDAKKHLLHHSSREDLMLMINLMDPKYYFPVKGEYRHQVKNAEIAERLGIPKENIILKQNGDVVEFVDGVLQETYEQYGIGEIEDAQAQHQHGCEREELEHSACGISCVLGIGIGILYFPVEKRQIFFEQVERICAEGYIAEHRVEHEAKRYGAQSVHQH